jgi:hypothetical protein
VEGDGQRVNEMLFAGSSLAKAQRIFERFSRSTNERTPFKLSDVDRREVGTITTRWRNGTRPNFTSKRYCM